MATTISFWPGLIGILGFLTVGFIVGFWAACWDRDWVGPLALSVLWTGMFVWRLAAG